MSSRIGASLFLVLLLGRSAGAQSPSEGTREDPPIVPPGSGPDPGAPAGTLTIWVVDDRGPVPSAPLVVTRIGETREVARMTTGPRGFVTLTGLDAANLRRIVVDCPWGRAEVVQTERGVGQVVVLRATRRADARRTPERVTPRRAAARLAIGLDTWLGLSASSSLGTTDNDAPWTAGLWVLGRRRWLEAGVGADIATTSGGPHHQFIGATFGARLDPADLLVEGGAHRIDPTSASDFEASYEAPTVVLPYLGVRLGLSWGRLPLVGIWAAGRFDLARVRTSVVESGTRQTDWDGCMFGPPCFESYTEESHWDLGGSSIAAGVRVGLWPF